MANYTTNEVVDILLVLEKSHKNYRNASLDYYVDYYKISLVDHAFIRRINFNLAFASPNNLDFAFASQINLDFAFTRRINFDLTFAHRINPYLD